MIMRDAVRELASFESPEGCAVSFYFQPQAPRNQSHKEEAILVKDLVRNALADLGKHGRNGARADLEKIERYAEGLKGNHARAKVVFACGSRGLWREYNLPARLSRSELVVNARFHLRPLAAILGGSPRCTIALVDRERARLFDLWMEHFAELDGIFDAIPRRGRSDGFLGFDAGHKDRKIDTEAMRHFKRVAERLQQMARDRAADPMIVGCRDETWTEFSPHLHSYVTQRIVGRFRVDPAAATAEQVRDHAQRILAEHHARERQEMVREVLGQAQRNGRGAIGLRNVLLSMERGEVQAILLGNDFHGRGTECRNCGHLDSRLLRHCPVCGTEPAELEDMSDVLLAAAIRNGIEIVYVPGDPVLEQHGHIAALLRFRADQSTPSKLAI